VTHTVDLGSRPDGRRAASAQACRPAFTLVELLVVISIIGLLVSMLAPAVQGCREAARRTQCANNLRQLAIAANAFHSCQGSFPPPRMSKTDPWGHFVRLLPYLDQAVAFKSLDLSKPVTDPVNERLAALPLGILLCPADTDRLAASDAPAAMPGWRRNNYRGNAGNDTGEIRADGTENNNGVFVTGWRVSADRISDGVSNTALFSEGLLGDGNDNVISNPGDWFVINPASRQREEVYSALKRVTPTPGVGAQVSLAGRTFTSGDYLDTRYNHIMPPNGPSGVAAEGSDLVFAINNGAQATTTSSRHAGGVNLALADASVRFVKNSVGVQVWWALGSIRGGEGVYEDY
jgi:prepilin-type N-terminal cleavage/methylation domain-containing protein